MNAPNLLIINWQTAICCSCSIPFAFPDYKYEQLVKEGTRFHCPNGHPQYYTESENTKLKRLLEQEQKRRTWAEQSRQDAWKRLEEEKRSKAAIRGALTKIKTRVKAGVCPCCNRTFRQLVLHMKSKHPGFQAEIIK
jgi:hypothetical protein